MAKKGNYSELLRDPRWQRLRLQVFERDNWTCQGCGCKDKTLAVHHLCYVRGKKPWEYDLAYLMTLCEDCHNYEYEERAELEDILLESLKVRGWLCEDLDRLIAVIDYRKVTPKLILELCMPPDEPQ